MNSLKMIFTALVILLLSSLSSAQFQTVSNSKSNPNPEIESFSIEMKEKILITGLALASEDFEIAEVFTTRIKKGTPAYFYPIFSKGKEYVIIAISDKGVYNLDMDLMDKKGNFLAKDDDLGDDGLALTEQIEGQNELVQIKVKNQSCINDLALYNSIIIVAHR